MDNKPDIFPSPKTTVPICAVCGKPAPHPIELLTCDCYGGCWGDHSKGWPSIAADSENKVAQLIRMLIPHGGYVFIEGPRGVGGHFRIEPHYFSLMKAGLILPGGKINETDVSS